MSTVKVKIERNGDDFRVLTSVDGSSWWGVGVEFGMWMAARAVAVAIARGAKMGQGREHVTTEIIDETEKGAALDARPRG